MAGAAFMHTAIDNSVVHFSPVGLHLINVLIADLAPVQCGVRL